jgi:hypothetical protein
MKVQCNSIGSVHSNSNAKGTECSECGGSKPHDIDNCEPCPWNPNATCMPLPEVHILTGDIDEKINTLLEDKREFLNNILK